MRIWSLHPRYLDRSGLLAVWREWLLAQAVLCWKTRGYSKHPQLIRFYNQNDPIGSIGTYLSVVAAEAQKRGYSFDASKIVRCSEGVIPVTDGQVHYERNWLLAKLDKRDPEKAATLRIEWNIEVHPIFSRIPWAVEKWEKVPTS